VNALYFVVRADIDRGRQMAQLIHAMDEWAHRYGSSRGRVIVYSVRNEEALLRLWESLPAGGKSACFHEPDLQGQMTAFATSWGPLGLSLAT
jgi:hypothetical protein